MVPLFSLSLDEVISMVDGLVFVFHFCRVIFTKKILVGFELITSLLQLLLMFLENIYTIGIFCYKSIICL